MDGKSTEMQVLLQERNFHYTNAHVSQCTQRQLRVVNQAD
jgi:hypothetical protein